MHAYAARVDWVSPGVTFRTVRSPGGYAPDELKSAMQKYIRRCDAPAAAYCARELCVLSMSECATPRAREHARTPRTLAMITNMIHRMMIICSEDIGPAMSTHDWDEIHTRIREVLDMRRAQIASDDEANEQCARLCELAAFLALLPKSRIVSHVRSAAVAWRDPSVLRETVETGALLAPINMPAALLHASAKYARVCECIEIARVDIDAGASVDDEARDETTRAVIAIARAFLSELNETEGVYGEWSRELRASRELFLMRMMAAAHRASFTTNARTASDTERALSEARAIAVRIVDLAYSRELDDFVFDKHTSRGRKSSAAMRGADGALQFALEGARIENEDPRWALRDFADFYVDKKMIEARDDLAAVRASFTPFIELPIAAGVMLEAEDTAWNFTVRAQLVTSMGHTDTYFAQSPRDAARLYLVKGPVGAQLAQDACAIAAIKRAICGDLPVIQLSMAQCARLSLALRSPLGMRAKWTGPATFIIARALRGSAGLARRMRSSACWPETEVVDWSANAGEWSRILTRDGNNDVIGPIALNLDIIRKIDAHAHGERAIRDLRRACYFRFAFGVRDNAVRNFILTDGARIVACDEDNYDCDVGRAIDAEWVDFLSKLTGAIADIVRRANAEDAREIAEWRSRLFILRANAHFAGLRDVWYARFARIDARLEYIERMLSAE